MKNRITLHIDKTKAQIAERLANNLVTQDKLDALHKSLDITDLSEYAKFQELKSIASIDGKLSLEEAMTVYGYLGEIPATFNNQSLEVKVVLTKIFAELLDARVKTATRR